MRTRPLAAAFLAATLAACAAHGAGTRAGRDSDAPAPQRPLPGSDRDAHGCLPSAGYAWCAATRRCERPWELARERGFDNTAQAFARFCAAPPAAPPP
jgi:hypothetical protein